ncbi:MAG: Ig-like domain-containing protein, partial [Clostridia bacterium]
FVNQRMNKDQIVSLALLGDEISPGVMFTYDSDQSTTAALRPQLVLESAAGVPTVTPTTTAEDIQSTTGLVITANTADGSSVTHFKISGITGGTLYKHDGVTMLINGDFITAAEGMAGLKFTPAANANSPAGDVFSFNVQAAFDPAGTGLSPATTATITVSEVNDPPLAVDDTLASIEMNSGAQTIPFATLLANDSPGPANESGQTLTITSISTPVGGTVSVSGSNVVFTPITNYSGNASFRYTMTDNGTTIDVSDPKSSQATMSFTIHPPLLEPTVTSAETTEDTQTTSGLVITPNAAEQRTATHYKVSGITGGTLYKHDGVTMLFNGDFITAAEGTAGLTFTPAANANSSAGDVFSFNVQAALDSAGTAMSSPATATITVTEGNDSPLAADDALASIDIDSGERTIPFATLLANDSSGPANESGQTLTITAVDTPVGGSVNFSGSNVVFTPATNYLGNASFRYTMTDNGTTNGQPDPKSSQASVTFVINQVLFQPTVTSAETTQDTQTASGLVISPNTADQSAATHYKISEITGGTLYKHDGTTMIHDGDFITAAEGDAGLKFTPATGASIVTGYTFSFQVQSALDHSGRGLSPKALATIRTLAFPPILSADTLNNNQVNPIEITFPDNALWRAAITAVKYNGTPLVQGRDYSISTGKITVEPGVLSLGSHTITVTATNYADASVNQEITSNNAILRNLSVSSGPLNESFHPNTLGYTQTVTSSIASLMVTPEADDPDASVTVNGVTVNSGEQSSPINLKVGRNTITVIVTAGDGVTTTTYTITVNRQSVTPSYFPVENITLSQPELTLTAGGDAASLKATITPSYATIQTVTWESSNTDVATVDEHGVVTPIAAGTATITVTTDDQAKTATSKVNVVEEEVKKLVGLKSSEKTILLKPKQLTSIKLYATYSDGSKEEITKDKGVTYRTSTSKIATFIKGTIRARSVEGTATLTATYQGETINIPVVVSKVGVKSLEMKQTDLQLETDQEEQLTLEATLSNKETEDVTELATWTSSDQTVATVDENGKVTAIASGTAVITATYGGETTELSVEVTEAKEVKRISVNKRNVTVAVDKEQHVKLTATYKDNSKKVVTDIAKWASEDESIATVKDGVISGKATGTVKIQAIYQGQAVTITVKVK